MVDGLCLTESLNWALRVMRFTIHTGLKTIWFELHHGRKPRTALANIVKDGKTYLSNYWSEMTVSAPDRPKIPIYVGRDAEGEITNHIIMAKTKNEEKQTGEKIKSTKKNIRLDILFHFRKELKQKDHRRELPKQNTNRNKGNREYRKN